MGTHIGCLLKDKPTATDENLKDIARRILEEHKNDNKLALTEIRNVPKESLTKEPLNKKSHAADIPRGLNFNLCSKACPTTEAVR